MALQTIYALFQNVADAERAIGALRDHGVPEGSIGIAGRHAAEQEEAGPVRDRYTRVIDQETTSAATYAPLPGTPPAAAIVSTLTPTSAVDTPLNVSAVGNEGITTTTPQDAAAGAAVGGGIGLVAGLLAAAAAVTIPGVGLILGGGILAGALGAAAATTAAGAAVGGVTGYLRDMGMPEHAAANVGDRLREGDYLLTVAVDPARYDEIKQLLLKYNAAGVDIEVSTANQRVTDVWGNTPAVAEHLHDGPAPLPHPVGQTPDEAMVRAEDLNREEALTSPTARAYEREEGTSLL